MNISAKELAKLINVSPATVSMVFNNKPGISDATRELVLKTAAEYGYAPKKNESSGASSRIIQLVNYKKHGKVAADTPFFSQLTEGISTECTRQGCALHISYFYETMDIDSQLDALRAVDCEGILLLATEMAPSDFRKFRDFSVPIVVVDCYYDELDQQHSGGVQRHKLSDPVRTQKRGLLSLEPRHQQLLRTRRRLLQSAPCKRYQHLASICPPGFPYLGRGLPRHAAPSRVESSDRRCLLCRQ